MIVDCSIYVELHYFKKGRVRPYIATVSKLFDDEDGYEKVTTSLKKELLRRVEMEKVIHYYFKIYKDLTIQHIERELVETTELVTTDIFNDEKNDKKRIQEIR